MKGSEIMSKQYKILLVDDNTINRLIISKLLKTLDLNVVAAEDGYEAIDIVNDLPFDMILMDVFMSGLDGFETCSRIRTSDTNNKDIPIIAVTSNTDSETLVKLQECGMNDMISKPIQKAEIEKIIKKYLSNPKKEPKKNNTLEVFDFNEYEVTYQSESLRIDILNTFLEECPTDFEKVKKAFASQDKDEIYSIVHYLKGSFGYLKAKAIFKDAKAICDLIKQGEPKKALKYEKSFIENFKKLEKQIKEYLAKQ